MAAELVGGALLSASLNFLFERLGSPEILAYLRGKSKRSDFDKLLGKLKSELNLISAVLDDAEQKETKNRSVDKWLDDLEEVFYDADDLLYEIETDALQLNMEAESTGSSEVYEIKKEKFGKFFRRSRKSSSSNLNDGNMESKIKKILERLENAAKQAEVLNLVKMTVRERPSWRPLPSTSLVDESGVYGRDDDKKEIIKLLLLSDDKGNEKISVIPIVGMGGIGKTTLAQAVFNDDQVKEHFEAEAWIFVSEDFDAFRIIRALLQSFSSSSYDEVKELNLLQIHLKESLTGKRFLIVLDDVWHENYVDWDTMRMPLTYGAQGSKIIVTTRSEEVASIMGTRSTPIYHLEVLKEEACWQLFARHALGDGGGFNANPNLQRIGRDIVKKCKGLPLAAKTLGGLLHSTLDVTKWERILNCEIWELADERSNILPALRLSYYYLPSHLKRCFAYCSIFPKDYELDKENLVLLWMAEDLLDPKKGKGIEELGNEYFDELVCRSFFQRSRASESLFVMHDLMNDLAKFVSRKYSFRLEKGNSDKIEMKTRHLACVMSEKGHHLCESFKSIIEATRLRTFIQLENNLGSICSLLEGVLKLRCLRVLSLSGHVTRIELPDSIGELRCLRHLDLSHTLIDRLPESVSMLCNLRSLKLRNCRELTKLPIEFHRLINLKHLDVENSGLVDMPKQLGKLKSLQKLSTFIVGKDNSHTIGELGKLLDLRGRLHIKNLHDAVVAKDASQAKLREKNCLEELELEWIRATDDLEHENKRDVLDNLLPSTALTKLKVRRYGGRKFPNWLGNQLFCNIVDINLSNCKYCHSLPSFGQLPSLKCLEIRGFHALVKVGPEFYRNSSFFLKSFVSLEILKFDWLPNWEEWSIPFDDVEAFPKLRQLSIMQCNKLTGDLPRFLPFLTELVIYDCPELASSLPLMPVICSLTLFVCERLTRLHVIESFGCLQHLQISRSLDSTTCRFLPTTLKMLKFSHCSDLEFPPLHSYYCPNLAELHIEYCNKLITSGIRWNSQKLPNLTMLAISCCTFADNLESFPEQESLPTTITKLEIHHLEWLKTLDNNELQQLSSLKSLVIYNCQKLQTINAEEGLPTSLQHFEIRDCPLMEGKLEREKGEYWNKISHIPQIYIY